MFKYFIKKVTALIIVAGLIGTSSYALSIPTSNSLEQESSTVIDR